MWTSTKFFYFELFILIVSLPIIVLISNKVRLSQEQLIKQDVVVKRVIDGDTFELMDGSKVRLVGIDAPEDPLAKNPNCYAKESSDFLKELIEGKPVILTKDIGDKDKYGRLLRYVYLDSIFINEKLVRLGYSKATPYPPDTLYQTVLLRAQQEAKSLAVGLWSCEY